VGVWGVVLVVCVCFGVGGAVLCRCVCVLCDMLTFLQYLGSRHCALPLQSVQLNDEGYGTSGIEPLFDKAVEMLYQGEPITMHSCVCLCVYRVNPDL